MSNNQQPRRDYHARITATGAVAINGMDRRKPDREVVMSFRRWIAFARFINGTGFRTFIENNKDKLKLNEYESQFLNTYLQQNQEELKNDT